MNILLFIPEINQEAGGVRQYAIALIHILAVDDTNKYFIYHDCGDEEIKKLLQVCPNLSLIKSSDVVDSHITMWLNRIKRCINFFSRRLGLHYNYVLPSTIDKICIKYGIDVIHCPYQYTPNTTLAKRITTLHDVQEIHFPEFFTPEQRAYRAVHYLQYMREANRVIVSYEHVKQDLINYFAVSKEKIDVILLNMNKLWIDQFGDKDIVDLGNLRLPSRYLLYPANTWQHKNHARLLDAIAFLKDEKNIIVNIVFSGHLTEYYDTNVKKKVDLLGLHEQVLFLGVVDEMTLYSLYKSCVGVVVPTLYEAGSFPLVESLLLGIPVVCSNVTSLPETIGDESFTFNPVNLTDMANKIKSLWESEAFRQQSIRNAKLMEQRLRNTGALEKFVSLYKHL